MVDAVGTTKYTYYAGGLLNTEDGPWSSDSVSYTYNNRLRASLSLRQPTGSWTNGYTRDAAHRLSTETSPAGTFTYNYKVGQAVSLPIKLSLPNSSYITNTYDNVARLTGTYLENSSNSVLDKSEYLYNTGNQRIRLTGTDGSYYTNTYDNIAQLKWGNSTVASEDRGYLYDAAWNLSKRTNNAGTDTFSVDSKNQYSSGPGGSFTYDDNGNLTYYGQTSGWERYFTYDAENQLISVQVPGYFYSTFTYDGRGRRRQRTEYTWSGSSWVFAQTINYIYDGMRVIQEPDNNGNTPLVSYTRGSDLSGSLEGAGGIGGMLARSHGFSSGSFTNHNYYHADGNGNITYMVNSSQGMVATYRYDPFGNTFSSSGTLAAANLYRFSSKEVDTNYTDSGLYYYGYRWYDPNLQRWPNRDPIVELGFGQIRIKGITKTGSDLLHILELNLYRFVSNDPLGTIDPLGLLSPLCKPIMNAQITAMLAGNEDAYQRLKNLWDLFGCSDEPPGPDRPPLPGPGEGPYQGPRLGRPNPSLNRGMVPCYYGMKQPG